MGAIGRTMHHKVILSGGGDEHDALSHHHRFRAWLDASRPLLYLPGDAFSPKDSLRWLTAIFEPLGIHHIEMWETPAAYRVHELKSFGGVYIGGGNTFHTLRDFSMGGLTSALKRYIESGLPVFGGSAGAIILGYDIMTCSHMDPNDIELLDTHGLDIVSGYSIWCHYSEKDDPLIHAYVYETKQSVLAISERSSMEVVSGAIFDSQSEGLFKFNAKGKVHILIGEPC